MIASHHTTSYLEEASKELANSRVNFLYHIALLEKCILNISQLSGYPTSSFKIFLAKTKAVKQWLRNKIRVDKQYLTGKEYKRHKPKPFRSQIGKYQGNWNGTRGTQSLINVIHGELRMLDNILSILISRGNTLISRQRFVPLNDIVRQTTSMRLKVLDVKDVVENIEKFYHTLLRRQKGAGIM